MPEQHAHIFEVLIGQMAECCKTNPVFSKTLSILGHAEFFEPICNLLHGGHQGWSWPDRGLDLGNTSLHQYVWYITLV